MDLETSNRASDAVRTILDHHHLAAQDIRILYRSNNLVLFLPSLSAVAKVVTNLGRPPVDKNLELLVSSHLQNLGVPCVAPFRSLPVQVYAHGEFQVTFWDYFEGEAIKVPDREKSRALIQRLHEGLASFQYEALPTFESKLGDFAAGLGWDSAEMPGLRDEDRDFLRQLLARLRTKLIDAPSTQWGVIHGDCRTDNLLWDKGGNARWIDFESTCVGPIAWDYNAFFPRTDGALNPYRSTLEILAEIANVTVAVRCWTKQNRTPPVQKAAETSLENLKRKYPSR